MPTIQGQTSIGPGVSVANVLAGSVYEYLQRNAIVEFGLVDDANGDCRVTIQSGADVLLEESPVSIAARFPIFPDDFVVEDVAAAGERLVIRVRNTDAATTSVFRWAVRIAWL